MIAFYHAVLTNRGRPRYAWRKHDDGSLEVTAIDAPAQVNLWQATNAEARDFRLDTIGKAYTQSALAAAGGNTYVARLPKPAKGFTAFFVELVYESGISHPFKFTTGVSVIPDTATAAWSEAAKRYESTRPDHVSMIPVLDRPGLPRVLLIGDSISMGYTAPVRKLLEGKANVHRVPANAGPTTRGLEGIDEWLGSGKWDVIHFNFGLHDLRIMDGGKWQVPVEDYERNLRALVARLQKTGAKLVWASTTPVPEGNLTPKRFPADSPRYNAAARRVMEENRIPINDLFEFAAARLGEIQLPSNVHFTDAGSRALAEKVVEAILGTGGVRF
jgi:acyl-CoA thioesterase-1